MAEITEEQFHQLKQDIEDAKSEADRARGALEQLLERMEQEFGCGSIKAAQLLYAKYQRDQKQAKERFDQAYADYQRKWNNGPRS